nr:ERT2-PhoCl-Cre-PhoCl-ERT2 [Expression vector pCAG-ERT2-PhoCl-Cre-PhoCl-ERT2]
MAGDMRAANLWPSPLMIKRSKKNSLALSLTADQMVSALLDAEPPILYSEYDPTRPFSEASMMGLLTNLADRELVHMINWAKRVPGFVDLTLHDQVHLLECAWLEILMIGLVWRSMEHPVKLLFAPNLLLDRNQGKCVEGMVEIFDMLLATSSRFRMMNLQGEEFVCLKSIILLNSGVYTFLSSTLKSLEEKDHIHRVLDKITDTLIHLMAKAGLTLQQQHQRLAQLLLILSHIRHMSNKGMEHLYSMKCKNVVPLYDLLLEAADAHRLHAPTSRGGASVEETDQSHLATAGSTSSHSLQKYYITGEAEGFPATAVDGTVIPDYFKQSFPEGYSWERSMTYEDGGICIATNDITMEGDSFINKIHFKGTNFPPNGPVMQKRTVGWEASTEKMYERDGVLKGDVKMKLLLKGGGHYRCDYRTTYKVKQKPVKLPDYHFVDHRIEILSHDKDYNKVKLYEHAVARNSTDSMDELYKGGSGGMVSKGEETITSVIKPDMKNKLRMEGNVNGHAFVIEGEGSGKPFEGIQTIDLEVKEGAPLPFAYDILTTAFHYGNRVFTKYPRASDATSDEVRKNLMDMFRDRQAFSEHTWKMLLSVCRSWAAWCKLNNRKWFPAEPEDVRDYLLYLQARGLAVKTIQQHLGQLNMLHRRSGLPRPSDSNAVSLVMRRIRKENVDAGERAKQALAFERTDFDQVRSLMENSDRCQDIRNLAFLGIAYNTLLRIAEIARIRVKDISRTDGGRMLIHIGRTKTLVSTAGVEKALSLGVTKLVERWISVSGVADDPNNYLFCRVRKNGVAAPSATSQLSTRALEGIFEATHRLIYGAKDDSGQRYLAWSGHSARVGAARDMARAGVSIPEIMQAGGWTNVNIVMNYIRNLDSETGAMVRLLEDGDSGVIPDYFKQSFPEGYSWERSMTYEDGGICIATNDITMEGDSFINKIHFKGTNFPPNGPVMQKRTVGWEASTEKMYERDGVLKGDVKMKLLLKGGGHYRCDYRTTYKVKQKPVKLPDYHFVDHRIEILSHDKDYNKVKLYEHAVARNSTDSMDELYKGGSGGMVSKGEETITSVIKPDMKNKLRMEGNVNGHAFVIEGEGSGKPFEGIQTIDLEVKEGAPLPFAYDILTTAFHYGNRVFTKYPRLEPSAGDMRAANLWPSPLMIKRSKKNSLALSLTADQMVSALLDAEPPILYSEYDPTRPFSEASMMGLLTNLADRELVHMINWAKRVPGFVDLTLHDQVHLLECAWLEILMIGLVWRSMEHPVKLLFAPNLLLDRNQGKCVEGMVEIFDMLLATSSRFRMMNLQGEEFVCLKSIILLNSGVYTFLSSTLKSLEEKDHIHRVLDKITDTLIHLMAKAGLTLQQQHQRLAQLLLILSHIRHMSNKGMEHLYSMKCKNVVPLYDLLLEAADAHRLHAPTSRGGASVEETDQSHLATAGSTSSHSLQKYYITGEAEGFPATA